MEEIWKPIYGFEGQYEISNYGRVKSLNYRRTGKECLLKPKKSANDYVQIRLSKNSVNKFYYIHRLVYETFVGPIQEGFEINHIDENKKNNSIFNLNLMTHIDNCNYGNRNEKMAKKKKGHHRK